MSITLQVSPELEKRLRKEASEKGMQLDSFLSKFLENSFIKKNKKNNSLKESELLQKINLGFPVEFWERYKLLVGKRQIEEISSNELAELATMTDRLEAANTERMGYLSELATLKKVSLLAIMKELDIKPHPVD